MRCFCIRRRTLASLSAEKVLVGPFRPSTSQACGGFIVCASCLFWACYKARISGVANWSFGRRNARLRGASYATGLPGFRLGVAGEEACVQHSREGSNYFVVLSAFLKQCCKTLHCKLPAQKCESKLLTQTYVRARVCLLTRSKAPAPAKAPLRSFESLLKSILKKP